MKFRSIHIFILLCLVFLSSACNKSDSEYTVVDFKKPLIAHEAAENTTAAHTLKVAVGAMISPKYTLSAYQELLDYIGHHLGDNVLLIQRDTYAEINELILSGEVDIAFICTGPYALGKKAYGFDGLVTPVIEGKPKYQAYLIVHKDSPVQTMEDLRGKSFAFTDPDSNTGYLVPRYWLSEMGETPEAFFSSFIFTHSHDNSIMAVAKSMVAAASVGSTFWDYFQARDPVFTSRTRIIKKSALFGGPPLVASKFISEKKKSEIRHLLVTMHEDPEGMKILEKLRIDRFLPIDDSWYESVREMNKHIAHGKKKENIVEEH